MLEFPELWDICQAKLHTEYNVACNQPQKEMVQAENMEGQSRLSPLVRGVQIQVWSLSS